MADVVNVGTTANDGNGDTLRSAFSQINARFNTIAGTLTGGDAWATGVTYTSTPVRNWVVNAGQAYVAASNHVSGATFSADLAAGKWLAVDVAQLIADLAASSGSSLVGYMPAGVGAVATTVQGKLRITAADVNAVTLESTQPCYAAVAVNITRTTIDRHAFEDWSTLNTTDANQGYCSFDSKPTMTTTQAQDHLVGYQSRAIYNGTNNLVGYMHGYDTNLAHNGTGTINTVAQIYLSDVTGTGPVYQNYGLLIDPITRGTSNAAIFSGPGNWHYLGGPTGHVVTGILEAAALNFGVDTVGKSITYGYGTAGTTNFGRHVFYDGKTTVLATLDEAIGLVVDTAIASNYTIKPGGIAYASLPAAPAGAMLYCTDGRKVGEGVGAGTGVPVYYSNGAWRVFSTDAIVTV